MLYSRCQYSVIISISASQSLSLSLSLPLSHTHSHSHTHSLSDYLWINCINIKLPFHLPSFIHIYIKICNGHVVWTFRAANILHRYALVISAIFLSPNCMYHQTLQWRHDERDGVSNHQPHHCLLKRLFRRRSKKTSKLRVTGLCEGHSSVTGEFPAQRASNAENVSIWWHQNEMRPTQVSWFNDEMTINITRRSFTWIVSSAGVVVSSKIPPELVLIKERVLPSLNTLCLKLNRMDIIILFSLRCFYVLFMSLGPLLLTWFNFNPSMDK